MDAKVSRSFTVCLRPDPDATLATPAGAAGISEELRGLGKRELSVSSVGCAATRDPNVGLAGARSEMVCVAAADPNVGLARGRSEVVREATGARSRSG